MQLKTRTLGQVTIVDIRGKITIGKADVVLRPTLFQFLDSDRRQILLNLDETTYVDSCGLSELIVCYRRARQHNGTIKLLKPRERVRDLLRITRLDQVLEIYTDEDAALASFGRRAGKEEGLAALLLPRPTPFLI